MEPARVQRALHRVHTFALDEQRERDTPRAPSRELERSVALRVHPFFVLRLEGGGESSNVTAMDGRERTAHRDRGVTVFACEVELHEATETAHQW
jgi:hypothetical protein